MRPVPLHLLVPVLLAAGQCAAAQSVPTESYTLARQQITLHLHPFLSAEEVALLRLVASNPDALGLFVTTPGRHSALAVAPAEGLLRGGMPVASAVAMSNLQSPPDARASAAAACERERRAGPACVVVLEVAPAR